MKGIQAAATGLGHDGGACDLRNATGLIEFGDSSSQIDHQNAGSALNNEMKKEAVEHQGGRL